MDERIKLLIRSLGEERVRENFDLSEVLETKLGGPTRVFYIATTTRELERAVQFCRDLKIEYMIIGTGSKVAFSEKGFSGLVIKNRSDNLKIFGVKGKVSRLGIGIEEAFIEADSGTSLIRLADFVGQQGLTGFEILRSTLGTIGGSISILPILRDKIHQVKVLTKNGTTKTKQLNEMLRDDVI